MSYHPEGKHPNQIAHQWSTGQSGSPNGRPPDPEKLFKSALIELLNEPISTTDLRPKVRKLVESMYKIASNQKKADSIRMKAMGLIRGVLASDSKPVQDVHQNKSNQVGVIVFNQGKETGALPIDPTKQVNQPTTDSR